MRGAVATLNDPVAQDRMADTVTAIVAALMQMPVGPLAEAVARVDPDSDAAKPYINVWVARAEDADDEELAKLVEISHSPEVVEAEEQASGGTAVIKDNSAEELQEILAGIEEDLRGQS